MGWLARLLKPKTPQTYTPTYTPAPRPPRTEKDFYGRERVVETDRYGQRVYRTTQPLSPYVNNPRLRQRAQERELRDTSGRLEVHHLTYDHHRDEWNHQGDLVTLCVSCHNADHVAKPWLHAPKPYPTYYQEFLATPYWNHVRKAVLRRDGYRCRSCGSAGHAPAPTFSMPRSGRGALKQMIRMLEET